MPKNKADNEESRAIEGTVQQTDGPIGEGVQLGPEGVEPVMGTSEPPTPPTPEPTPPTPEPPQTQAPNIIFVGEGEPPTAIHGVFKTTLPDAATQRAGFYHPQARQIIRLFSKQYKRYQRLGDV